MHEILKRFYPSNDNHDSENNHTRYERIYPTLTAFGLGLVLLGFCFQSPSEIYHGLIKIVSTEASLITDFVALAGLGAALVNSGLVTLISIAILWAFDETANGMTIVAVGLMSGFALFGKDILNIWPIIFGSFIYSQIQNENFGKYAILALTSTALSPMVTFIALDPAFGNVWTAILVGIIIGIVLPPLSTYTFQIQNGMNLYNTGFACGLVAMMFVPLMTKMGATPDINSYWASEYNVEFFCIISGFCILLILLGLFAFPLPAWAAWAGYRRLLQTSGRSPSDYLRMFGAAPVMINTGVNGLISLSALMMVEGDLNGPTVGAILTIMGFSSFGKHAMNIIPVMLGAIIGTVLSEWGFADNSVQISILFCTTLAPISGYFGWFYGIIAGFFHSAVVIFTSTPVAGMNLYNNGFAGGLVAIFLYPIILALVRHRKAEVQNKDYFDIVEYDDPIMPPEHNDITEESISPYDYK